MARKVVHEWSRRTGPAWDAGDMRGAREAELSDVRQRALHVGRALMAEESDSDKVVAAMRPVATEIARHIAALGNATPNPSQSAGLIASLVFRTSSSRSRG